MHIHTLIYSTAVARKRLLTADFPCPLRYRTIRAPAIIFSQKRLTTPETRQLSNSHQPIPRTQHLLALVVAAASRYTASARTGQRTHPVTALLLLRQAVFAGPAQRITLLCCCRFICRYLATDVALFLVEFAS
jgi:hypothetical protein